MYEENEDPKLQVDVEASWNTQMTGILKRAAGWRSNVPQEVLSRVDPEDIKRQHALFEFVEKEALFHEDLKLIIDEIDSNPQLEHFLSHTEREYVFGAWRQLEGISKRFTDALRERQAKCSHVLSHVGDLCLEHMGTKMRKTFTNFITHKPMISSLISHKLEYHQSFVFFLKTIQSKTKNLDFEAFLLLPIQQITRYPLLLERILKYTPDDHKDYMAIKEAQKHAVEMTMFANEQQRFAELQVRLVEMEQILLIPDEFDNFSLRGCINEKSIAAVSLLHLYEFQCMKSKESKEKDNRSPRKVQPMTTTHKVDVSVRENNKKGEWVKAIKRVTDTGRRKILILGDSVTGSYVILLGEVTEDKKTKYLLQSARIPIENFHLVPQTQESHITGVDVDTDIVIRYETVWKSKNTNELYLVVKADRASYKKDFEKAIGEVEEGRHVNVNGKVLADIKIKSQYLKSRSIAVGYPVYIHLATIAFSFVSDDHVCHQLLPTRIVLKTSTIWLLRKLRLVVHFCGGILSVLLSSLGMFRHLRDVLSAGLVVQVAPESVDALFLHAAGIISRLMTMFRGNQGQALTPGDQDLLKTLVCGMF